MRKDSVQPRKRKQPAQGRKRKRKGGKGGKGSCTGKENRETDLVLGTLLHNYCKSYSALLLSSGDKENETKNRKARSPPTYETFQIHAQLKTYKEDELDFLEEEEDKYKWPASAFDLANIKTEDGEVSSSCVAPGEVSRGMRDYSCSHAGCRHLQFSCLDGPSSVREHIKLFH